MTGRRQIGLDDSVVYRSRRHVSIQDVSRPRPSQTHTVAVPKKTMDVKPPTVTPASVLPGHKSSRTAVINPVLPRQAKSVVLARQMVQRKPKKRVPHITRRSRVSILLVMMAAVIFVGGSSVSYFGWKAGQAADSKMNQQVLASNTEKSEVANTHDSASEEEILPEVIAGYTVASDLPRLIRIPRLQVEARIKRIVASDTNEISAPNNIYDAGWYDASNRPGHEGVTLLTGYASGPTKSGIFHRLGVLKQGDTIEIERGDGTIYSYKVAQLELVDHDKFDVQKGLTAVDPAKPGLTLVTFSDRYDIRSNKYEQKNIIYAVQE